MNENAEPEPKINIDEDWKAQVEQEKKQSEPEQPASEATRSESTAVESGSSPGTPPPASFETLVTMLFTQALAALGQIPGPDGSPHDIDKPLAKYFIDTLEMLGEKTQGNLTPAESKLLAETLHGMRMAYVSIKAR